MAETIGHTHKNVRMKEITFLKSKTEMGDDEFTPSTDMVDIKIFKYQIREYANRLTIMRNGLKAAFYLAWGQFREAIHNKLQSLLRFEQERDDYDVIELIQLIQAPPSM